MFALRSANIGPMAIMSAGRDGEIFRLKLGKNVTDRGSPVGLRRLTGHSRAADFTRTASPRSAALLDKSDIASRKSRWPRQKGKLPSRRASTAASPESATCSK